MSDNINSLLNWLICSFGITDFSKHNNCSFVVILNIHEVYKTHLYPPKIAVKWKTVIFWLMWARNRCQATSGRLPNTVGINQFLELSLCHLFRPLYWPVSRFILSPIELEGLYCRWEWSNIGGKLVLMSIMSVFVLSSYLFHFKKIFSFPPKWAQSLLWTLFLDPSLPSIYLLCPFAAASPTPLHLHSDHRSDYFYDSDSCLFFKKL